MMLANDGFCAARSRIIRSSISTATGPVATISASRSSAAGIVANDKHDQALGGRHRHELEHGCGSDRQRSFRADDQPRQIELPGPLVPAGRTYRQTGHEFVEVVAAHPAQDVREPVSDRLPMFGDRVADDAMERADRIGPGQNGVELTRGYRPERRGRAVGQDGLDRVERGPPSCRSGASGRRPSCCRSSRRSWPDRWSRRRART